MSLFNIIVGFFLGFTLIVGVAFLLNLIMQNGLFDQLITGMNLIADLMGSGPAYIFVALFTIAGMTLFVRFLLSWFGENAGQSANKG